MLSDTFLCSYSFFNLCTKTSSSLSCNDSQWVGALLWNVAIHHMHIYMYARLSLTHTLGQVEAKISCPNLTPIQSGFSHAQTNKHHIHTIVCVCKCKPVLLIIADNRIWFNPMWYLYNAGGRVVVPNQECFSFCSWYLWQEVLRASPPVLSM